MPRPSDKLNQCKFQVEIDGISATGFETVEGLEREFGVREERNGNEPNSFRKVRTIEKFTNAVLAQGVTTVASELADWYKSGERKAVSIIQQDEAGNEVLRWNLVQAMPVKYKPFEKMDSSSDDGQIRTLELAYEGID